MSRKSPVAFFKHRFSLHGSRADAQAEVFFGEILKSIKAIAPRTKMNFTTETWRFKPCAPKAVVAYTVPTAPRSCQPHESYDAPVLLSLVATLDVQRPNLAALAAHGLREYAPRAHAYCIDMNMSWDDSGNAAESVVLSRLMHRAEKGAWVSGPCNPTRWRDSPHKLVVSRSRGHSCFFLVFDPSYPELED